MTLTSGTDTPPRHGRGPQPTDATQNLDPPGLSSPLTSIRAYANLIADAEHDERVEFAERILSNAERLDELVGP